MSVPKIIQDIRNLKRRIKDIEENNLVGKYHIPTVTTNGTGNEFIVYDNPIPSTWVYDSGISGLSSGGYEVSNGTTSTELIYAFDQNSGTSFKLTSPWIRIKFPTPLKIVRIIVNVAYSGSDTSRNTFTIQASHTGGNSDSEWVTVSNSTSRMDADGEYSNMNVNLNTNGQYYQYYRFITNSASAIYNNVNIKEIYLHSYYVKEISNDFVVSDIPEEFQESQRVLILTSSETVTTAVTQNTLNGIPIDILLEKDKYYELVYRGNIFIAREG